MLIRLKKELVTLLRSSLQDAKSQDVEEAVNSILAAYLHKEFIRKSEIEGVFHLKKVIRKSALVGDGMYDAITNQFRGVSVQQKESEAVFIPCERLMHAIEDNKILLVMKSPRGVSDIPNLEHTDDLFITGESASYL